MRTLWHSLRWVGILIGFSGVVGVISALAHILTSLESPDGAEPQFSIMLALFGAFAVAGIALEREMDRRLRKLALGSVSPGREAPLQRETEREPQKDVAEMARFQVKFADPLPEITHGVRVRPDWDPGGRGFVSMTSAGLAIWGPTRLSVPERWLGSGPLGEIFIKTFFQSRRARTREYKVADITSVVLAADTVHVFATRATEGTEIISFRLDPWFMVSRPYLWLFWGFLTKLLPSAKLELRSEELTGEIDAVAAQDWRADDIQCRIATAFLQSVGSPAAPARFGIPNDLSQMYARLFGKLGFLPAKTMLSVENPMMRALAKACFSRTSDGADMDALLPLLSDDHPSVRLALVHALSATPSTQVRDGLLSLLRDSNAEVRLAVVRALVKVPSPETRKGLEGAVNDTDRRVKRAAQKALHE